MNRSTLLSILIIAFSLLLAACASADAPAPEEMPIQEDAAPAEEPAQAVEEAPAAKIALKVTGAVASEQAWTEDEVKAMNTLDVESTNNSGEKSTYSGVLIADLLVAAQPNADASTVVFVADDGSSAEISLEEAIACDNCILSFRNKGGFSSVLPAYPGKLQIKGVVELQVK